MTRQLFFDPSELKRGKFVNLVSAIKTEEGRSYELEDWIGRGGNASVFRCRESGTGDEYAIKFLLNTGTRNVKRFLREIKLLQQLIGDHVTRYRGSGRISVMGKKKFTIPFIVMELADCNLQDSIRDNKENLHYEQYAGQFRGLARALASLHKIAVHRDIKPENILVTGERWLLSDYGLCSFVTKEGEDITVEGKNIGPKYWLSPEAHNQRVGCGDHICEASDVYQLAAVFWYVGTGRHPSGILTVYDWAGPAKLFDLLHRSLLHNLSLRPQNGSEFLLELESALSK